MGIAAAVLKRLPGGIPPCGILWPKSPVPVAFEFKGVADPEGYAPPPGVNSEGLLDPPKRELVGLSKIFE